MRADRKKAMITAGTVVYSVLLFFVASYLPVLTKKAAAALTWVVYARIVRRLMGALVLGFAVAAAVRFRRLPHRRAFLGVLGVFIAVSVFFLSRLGDSVNEYVHYPQYAALVVLWYLTFRSWLAPGGGRPRAVGLAVAVSVVLGILEEGLQHFLPGRVFDIQDILLNFCGVWLGLLLLWMFAFPGENGKPGNAEAG